MKPLQGFDWIRWEKKDIQEVAQTVLEYIRSEQEKVVLLLPKERTFLNTIFSLERAWGEGRALLGILEFLSHVSPRKEIREAAHKASDEVQAKFIGLSRNKRVFQAVKELALRKPKLNPSEQKILEDSLREYRRMGLDLPPLRQKKLEKILKEIQLLESKFSQNLANYRDQILVSETELQGLSERYRKSLRKDKKTGKFIVSLDYPEYVPFMEFAESAERRKELALKNLQKGGRENIKLLSKIVALRKVQAKLLGYASYPHYRLETRMAKKPQAVAQFSGRIAKLLKPLAQKDHKALLVEKGGGAKKILFYENVYYAEKLRARTYKFDAEELREYFSVAHVRQSAFEIFSEVLGVDFVERKDLSLWSEEAEMFEVRDSLSKKVLGFMGFDLYPREGKYTHAAMFGTIPGRAFDYLAPEESYINPLGIMVCNFPKPSEAHPSLLSHEEVVTYFHEFGHLLHAVLTRTPFASVSGTGVARDFSEMPSQIAEYWAWNKELLKRIGRHYKTGAPIPEETIESLLRSKNFMKGMWVMRQVALGVFDLTIHQKKVGSLVSSYASIMKKYTNIEVPKSSLQPAGFGHLAGGYDVGYYGYMWAEAYAADMFSRFRREGLLSKKAGRDYRTWILEKGGSLPEMDLVKKFLGRLPNEKALLKEFLGKS